jgi:hypothetical protein
MNMQVAIGKNITLEVDFANMPQASLDHIMYIGARNILMDSHASITATDYPDEAERMAAATAMAEKKLAALMRGEVRAASSRVVADPVQAEAMRMAHAIVAAKLRADGKKVKDYEPKALREAAAKLVTPELLKKAARHVTEAKAIESASANLADLGL